MEINHIGYAVKNIERAIRSFGELGFIFDPVINDYDRNVYLAFGSKDGYCVELVSPIDKKMESPVDIYLSNIGPTPYHICYQTSNLQRDISELEKQGFRVIIQPQKAIAFNNARVVFLLNLAIGLIELVEVS